MKPSLISMGSICIDCDNASDLADFYKKLLGWEMLWEDDDMVAIRSNDGIHAILFQTVENYQAPVWPWQEGQQDQMMHFDFETENVEEAVQFALECGAKLSEVQYFKSSTTMFDPCGHPFCLCPKSD